jgi:chloride channel protein, CIC family
MDRSGERFFALRSLSALRQSRKLHLLRAAIVGICVGLVAIAFELSISVVEHFMLNLTHVSRFSVIGWVLFILTCSFVGASVSWLTQYICREASGSGIPHVKAVLLHLREIRVIRLFFVKFFGGVLALGTGFSLGREGPTVHLGATVADGIAKFLKVPKKAKSHLIACGAGAGLAAAFNAPLAGFIFVIEELRRELSPITYGVAFVAAVTADAVTRFFMGSGPALNFTSFEAPEFSATWPMIAVGLIAGGGGILFNETLIKGIKRTPESIPLPIRGAVVGAIIGIVTLIFPYATANIQRTFDHVLHITNGVEISVWIFIGYFTLKYILTIASYLTGVPGGIFAPMLIQGALLGVIVGRFFTWGFPETALPDGMYAMVGMCAFFAASVRAPLTGVVLISEMTGNFELLFILLVAALAAYLLGELIGGKPIYERLMEFGLRKPDAPTGDDDEAILVDITVEPHSKLDGASIREVQLPKGCLIITIRKEGKELVPHGNSTLNAGDELVVLLEVGALSSLQDVKEAASGTL